MNPNRFHDRKKSFAAIGLLLLLALPLTLALVFRIQDVRTSAALPDALETESGVLSSSGVSKQSDSGASGGSYVRFARSASGPTPTSSPNPGGLGPQGIVGPRYDHYDGQIGGNFPTLGVLTSWGQGTNDIQLYSGSPVSWQADNVYIVPDWVATSNDVAGAFETFLHSVPDGASAQNPTFVVFDRSQNGENSTGYGKGTEYILNKQIHFGEWGRFRKNIVLWGYNSKLKFTTSTPSEWPPGLLSCLWGSWENLHVVGFEISGPSADWMWEPSRTTDIVNGPSTENHAGGTIVAARGLRVLDNYFHHVAGMFDIRSYAVAESMYGNHLPYTDDVEFGWNRAYWSMNQSQMIQQGWNIHFHNNYMSDARQKIINYEETNENLSAPANRNVNWTFSNNRIEKWAWQPPSLNATAMVMNSHWGESPSGQVTMENFKVLNNEWVYGYANSGHPNFDPLLICQPLWNAHASVGLAFVPGPGIDGDLVGLTIQGNVSKLDQAIVDVGHHVGHCFNYTWGEIHDWRDITITDNDFQSMNFRVRNISNLTWERNGTSQAVPY